MMRRFPDPQRRALIAAASLSPLTGLPDLCVAAQSNTTSASKLKVEEFFRHPLISAATLSPDGKLIAGTRITGNGRVNVVVVDVSTRKATIITNFSDGDVLGLRWINERRLCFSVYDRRRGGGDQHSSGLFAINADASNFVALAERSFLTDGKKLLPYGTSMVSRVQVDGKLTDDIIVISGSYQALGRSATNLYRLDTLTGRHSLLTIGNPGNVFQWVLDENYVPRVATQYRDETTIIHFKDTADAPWREIYRFADLEDERSIEVDALRLSDNKLYVTAYAGQDTNGLYMFDPKTGKLDPEPVLAIPNFDANPSLVWSQSDRELTGISYEAIKKGTLWLDEERAAIQAKIDATLPDTTNDLRFAGEKGKRRVLVSAHSVRDPGKYYLFDQATDKLELISEPRPWLKPQEMAAAAFFRYTARDGMPIPAQIWMPDGVSKPPLIVLHYGGPWVRPISFRFDVQVQFLVSRGYAVFMPAPRASTGFGLKLYRAGFRQWGLGMQDDVTDGVRFLIEQGKVDPKRICLMGASYGGYLTMMGLAKEPELFKCGINWVGVTDPVYMFTVTWTDFNRYGGPDTGRRILIGDPEKDAEQFARTSPVKRAAEIKQPVLMAYGALDQRVPLINGESMRAALRPHNKDVEWVVYPDEGHGFYKDENNFDFWNRVERFLAKHLA